MGRQRGLTAKGAARREHILDAAIAVLAQSGYAELSLRNVAEAVGMRLGNLQHYFPTKALLIAALLDRKFGHELDRIGRLFTPEAVAGVVAADHLDAAQGQAAIAEAVEILLAEQLDRDASIFFYDLWAMAAHDDQVAPVVKEFYERYLAAVAEALLIVSPAMSTGEARARGQVILAVLEGSSLFRSGIIGALDPAADEVLRRLLRELAGMPG